MEREIKMAIEAWKQANGKAKAHEHKAWAYWQGREMPCNGVIVPRNTYYKPRGK
jgi:hypothetical protein